jgi:hypothetical protein
MQESQRTIIDFFQFYTDGRPTQCATTDNPVIVRAVEQGHQERQAHYRPAKEMRHAVFCKSHKQLLRILANNPTTIRRQRPRPNRLLVHAGDFRQYIQQQARRHPSELLDCSPEPVDATLVRASRDMQRRKAKERAKKIRNQG